jgi:hypothetical protein
VIADRALQAVTVYALEPAIVSLQLGGLDGQSIAAALGDHNADTCTDVPGTRPWCAG